MIMCLAYFVFHQVVLIQREQGHPNPTTCCGSCHMHVHPLCDMSIIVLFPAGMVNSPSSFLESSLTHS